MNRFGMRGLLATALAGSMLFGGSAYAHNEVPVGDAESIIVRSEKLRALTDRIASITEKTPGAQENVSNLLFETAVHESQGLKFRRQVASYKKGKPVWGVGRSIFMVEPDTAKYLIDFASRNAKARNLLVAESGKTFDQLSGMGKNELATLMMEHDHFAAAMARTKYLSVPGKIPGTVSERASYWAKYYMAGEGKTIKAAQYLSASTKIAEDVRAARTAKIIQDNIAKTTPTVGLTNKVLHESKISSKGGTATSKAVKFLKKIKR